MKAKFVSIYSESESASEAERESYDQSVPKAHQGPSGVVGNSNTILLFEAEGQTFALDLFKVIRWEARALLSYFHLLSTQRQLSYSPFHSHSTLQPSFSHASIFRRACLLISRYSSMFLYSSLPSEDDEPATGPSSVGDSGVQSFGA